MIRNRSAGGASSTQRPGASAIHSFLTRSGQRTANSAAIQPPRLTPPDDLVQAQLIEEFDIVKGHVLDGVDLLEAAAFAEARVRRHDDAKPLRPCLVERQPQLRLAERAVQVDERRPLAAVEQGGR